MGGGVTLSESESALIDVAEALNVPIIQTYMAKGGVPLAHRLNAGHMGIQVGQPLGNRMFLDSDLVLAVGCRFSDRHTGGIAVYRGERKFIHVDIERTQIGKVFQPDLGVVSDAGLFLKKLLGALKAAEFKPFPDARIEAMNAMRASMERKTDYDDCPIMPHRVFHEVNRGFDSDTMFTAGCGITQIWGGQLQKIDKPMRYLPSGGAGTLGYEIPAAFGAKVAHPERTSVTVVGDFGFTFLGEEIAVSAVYGKPIIVVILNNAYLGLIRQKPEGRLRLRIRRRHALQPGWTNRLRQGCRGLRLSGGACVHPRRSAQRHPARKSLRPHLRHRRRVRPEAAVRHGQHHRRHQVLRAVTGAVFGQCEL